MSYVAAPTLFGMERDTLNDSMLHDFSRICDELRCSPTLYFNCLSMFVQIEANVDEMRTGSRESFTHLVLLFLSN